MRYVGKKLVLKNKTALTRSAGKHSLWVQFDDTRTGIGIGWYRFKRSQFRLAHRNSMPTSTLGFGQVHLKLGLKDDITLPVQDFLLTWSKVRS